MPSYYSIVKDSSADRGVNFKIHQNSPTKFKLFESDDVSALYVDVNPTSPLQKMIVYKIFQYFKFKSVQSYELISLSN